MTGHSAFGLSRMFLARSRSPGNCFFISSHAAEAVAPVPAAAAANATPGAGEGFTASAVKAAPQLAQKRVPSAFEWLHLAQFISLFPCSFGTSLRHVLRSPIRPELGCASNRRGTPSRPGQDAFDASRASADALRVYFGAVGVFAVVAVAAVGRGSRVRAHGALRADRHLVSTCFYGGHLAPGSRRRLFDAGLEDTFITVHRLRLVRGHAALDDAAPATRFHGCLLYTS